MGVLGIISVRHIDLLKNITKDAVKCSKERKISINN
jgi:hypothetical protein